MQVKVAMHSANTERQRSRAAGTAARASSTWQIFCSEDQQPSPQPSAVCCPNETFVRGASIGGPAVADAAARSVSGQITWPSDRRALPKGGRSSLHKHLDGQQLWSREADAMGSSASSEQRLDVAGTWIFSNHKTISEYLVLGSVTSTFRSNDHEQSQSACVTLSRIRSVNQPLGLLG